MSRIFGPVTQNGYIVRDLDEAIKHWTEVLGVGPFFIIPVKFDVFRYRGQDSEPEVRVALANSGDLQIELIEVLNDAPSFYKDFIGAHGPGMQHMSVWSSDFDADVARYKALGLPLLAEGSVAGGIRFCFFDTDLHTGCTMEVAEMPPPVRALMDRIRNAAVDWDGSDPVRQLGKKATP